jgi:hypothetical protein
VSQRLQSSQVLSRRVTRPSVAAIGTAAIWAAAILSAAPCWGADDDLRFCRNFSAGFGAGWTAREGGGIDNGYNLNTGAAWALPPAHANPDGICDSHWRLYFGGDFLFRSSSVKEGSVQQAIQSNPQTPALLTAEFGNAKYYSALFGPTLRVRLPGKSRLSNYVAFYWFGRAGWLRRSLNFTGEPIGGELIQPSNPVAVSITGNSGAFDFGAGISIGPFKGLQTGSFFIEARRLHGLGINTGTTMWPLVAGFRW